ncbi:MAG: hypothetical protein IKT27_05565 [Clostridia bacterium]|jgi:predicted metal-dependent hydrolase|nr:hypothetical protein [Clostridia bacterium]
MAKVDIENVKARIDRLKNERSEAEGKKKAIEETWQRDYNVSTLEEAEELKDKIEKELEDNRAAQEEYLDAADKLLTEAGV